MLDQLDDALKHVLERRGVTEPIVFDTPDADWGARISQPTLNLFLWDIRRSMDQSEGRDLVATQSGDALWRRQRPRIEFHYLITAWTTVVGDEHRLLGDALVAILGSDVLAGEDRPAFVASDDPVPTMRVARSDGKDLADFWGAIDGKLKPGLNVVVTMSVDPGLGDPAGVRTTSYEVQTGFLEDGEVREATTAAAIGWEHESPGALVTSMAAADDSGNAPERTEAAAPTGVSHVITHVGGRHRSGPDGKATYLVKGVPGDRIAITSPDGTVETYTFPPVSDRPVVTERSER